MFSLKGIVERQGPPAILKQIELIGQEGEFVSEIVGAFKTFKLNSRFREGNQGIDCELIC